MVETKKKTGFPPVPWGIVAIIFLYSSSYITAAMLWIKVVGAFFALEGAANIYYWYRYGNGVKDNDYWQWGRVLRMILGIALVVLG